MQTVIPESRYCGLAAPRLQTQYVGPKQEAAFLCPLCHRSTGRHDRLSLHDGDKLRVIVRCDACRHRWTVLLPASDADADDSPA